MQQTSYPCSGCSSASCGVHTTASGTLSDGPSNYADNANCKWLIAPPSATKITFTVTEFNLEDSFDLLTLSSCTDASCGSKQQVLRHTGTSIPPSVTTTTGFLLVEFTTDGSVMRSGFTATWTSEAAVVSVIKCWCSTRHSVYLFLPEGPISWISFLLSCSALHVQCHVSHPVQVLLLIIHTYTYIYIYIYIYTYIHVLVSLQREPCFTLARLENYNIIYHGNSTCEYQKYVAVTVTVTVTITVTVTVMETLLKHRRTKI